MLEDREPPKGMTSIYLGARGFVMIPTSVLPPLPEALRVALAAYYEDIVKAVDAFNGGK